MSLSEIKQLIVESFKEWQTDKASRLAAALSYYTVFSIPPLLTIALAIAGRLVGQQAARAELMQQSQNLVGETGAEAIQQILENASQPEASSLAAIIGIAVLLFGASGVFMQLQDAMNTIWNVQPSPDRGIIGTIKDRFLSFSMVVGVGFLLLVSLIISSMLAAFYNYIGNWQLLSIGPLAQVIDIALSFIIVTFLFALIFKVIPDVQIKWRDVWPGAVVTAFLFTIGEWALSFYLGNMAPESTYGAAGSLIVLLLWVYYSAQILFFGAEFTQVYAHKFGSYILESQSQHGAVTRPTATATTPTPLDRRLAIKRPSLTAVTQKTALAEGMTTYNRYVINVLAIPVAAGQLIRRLWRHDTV
ncbi:MAG TPA: YihY/virulence factor BrkB family protein [Chloroflexota bacterium]|nr:YihY/virulence factor BrkB family protein [Chloroflexota bacterium]